MSGLLWDIHAFVEVQNDEYEQAAKGIEKNVGEFISKQKLGDKDDVVREYYLLFWRQSRF